MNTEQTGTPVANDPLKAGNNTPSLQVNIHLPVVVMHALDDYIRYGNNADIIQREYPENPFDNEDALDINRSSLIRFLLSGFGHRESAVSRSLNAILDRPSEPKQYVTVRSKHPAVIVQPTRRNHRLINAMVHLGIPIDGLFDGDELIVPLI